MTSYRITNTSGITGAAWKAEYATQIQAAEALRQAMGWSEIHMSAVFADGNGERDNRGYVERDAVCAYETEEDRDSDGDGADAPRITRWTK